MTRQHKIVWRNNTQVTYSRSDAFIIVAGLDTGYDLYADDRPAAGMFGRSTVPDRVRICASDWRGYLTYEFEFTPADWREVWLLAAAVDAVRYQDLIEIDFTAPYRCIMKIDPEVTW